jgi:hypothetical protein
MAMEHLISQVPNLLKQVSSLVKNFTDVSYIPPAPSIIMSNQLSRNYLIHIGQRLPIIANLALTV